MKEENKVSRRKVIGGIGAGLAAAVVGPVLSAQAAPKTGYGDPEKLMDPTTKYPRPPFKSQSQPWQVLPVKWIRVRIMERPAIKDRVV